MNPRAMKKYLLPLLAALGAVTLAPSRADLLLQPNDLVAITGDSITEQKRYSVLMEDYFLMCQPTTGLSALQFGSGGAGAYVGGARTPDDLVLFHPQVATMLYGMNDGQYKPLNEPMSAGFRKGTQGTIEAYKKIGVRVILVSSPTCICAAGKTPDQVPYNATLAAFGDMAKQIAHDEGVAFTDVHGIMAGVITKGVAANPAYSLGNDGVHQDPAGHLIMAYGMLRGLGCDGAIGTITVDLANHTATGTPGQKIVSVDDGKVQVESTRYPFCFTGDPANPASTMTTLDVIKYLPFNDDLNRYLLVVKGLTASRAKVTWGSTSHEFSAADLAKGVNLAAAFAGDNPFSAPFAKVDAAVLAQQTQETALTKNFLGDFRSLTNDLPDQGAILDEIAQKGIAERNRLAKAAAALVVPVDHTITIEPLP
jgi:lysophospholipase L1-like esterase